MTTLAGLSPMSATAGTQCPGLATGIKSTDAYGDGCLATNGIFGAAGRGGVVADPFGNIFVADDVDAIIHMINPTSGIMTVAAGNGAVCSAKVDSAGDGCVAATQTVTKGQRGIGIDPYGNVLLAGYSDSLVHVICRTASPLCSAAQTGSMLMVAGCVATTGGSATAGVGLDNVQAAQVGVGTCSTSTGEVDEPRGVTADIYGNVYFADTNTSRTRVVVGPLTSSYFAGNNPLYVALGAYYASVTQGYVYSVVNTTGTSTSTGGTATTKGTACQVTTNSVVYSGTALDALGDGCPLEFSSVKASSGYTSGVAVDAAGNILFTDPDNGLRVFYVSGAGTAGAAMTTAILANDGNVAPQPGFIYLLAGGGSTSPSSTPTLGSSTAITDSTITKLTVSPQGNVYIGDNSKVLFYDMSSGYIRTLFTGSSNVTAGSYCSGSSGQTSLSAYSDACPASKSLFSNNNGLGVAVDGQGNLYLYDATSNSTGMLVRKVLAQGLAEQTLGTGLTQTFEVHLPESVAETVSGATATLTSTLDMTAGTPSCAQNTDNSVDCTVAVTATPSGAGLRSSALTIALPSGSWENSSGEVALGGTVSGSVLTVDNASTIQLGTSTGIAPTTSTIFSSIAPVGVAVDGAGNVYAMDANSGSILESVQGGAGIAISGTLPASPMQIAVDQIGDVFAVGSGTAGIEELKVAGAPASSGAPATFTAATVPYSTINGGTPSPQAVAVDGSGNLFVADRQSSAANTAIYRLSQALNTSQSQTTAATGFNDPVSLAVDNSGNVYVADRGAGAVYKLAPGVGGAYTQTTLLTGVMPTAVATDAAGDVYVQDESSASVLMIPVSGPTDVTVLSGLSSPTGLAVDGNGDVFSADSNATNITEVLRGALSYNFGTNEGISYNATLTDAGSAEITGSNTVTNTTNFNVVGGSANGCPFASSILGALGAGQACTLSATLVGGGTGNVVDALSFLPSASTLGSLTLSGTLQGTAIATSTAISAPTPSAPIYSPSGTEATFTVTVSSASGSAAPGGTVAVTVDSTTSNPSLVASGSNGMATVTFSGLTAGTHTISAVYGTTGSFTGSTSGAAQSFSIAPIATAVTWAPGATTQQVSQAISSANLDAAAAAAIPGSFVYTATPFGGSPITVDASTYLPIGTYSLAVTFQPDDSTDYTSSTSSVATYTVTQATGTPIAGATTNLVAADGTGNYTTLSAALAELPTTGGTIYIKPGTYTGQNAISYPNVSLRGLGGDPTKVILTGEDGAFSSPFAGYLGTGSGSGNSNASGDQGSSVLDVTKGYTMGQSSGSTSTPIGIVNTTEYSPNNFYAEYLTVQNTYNTDSATTSIYSAASGTCENTGTSQSLQSLYNAGAECSSQALALWIESDQAILNHVNLTSQQDTLYAGSQGCGSSCTPARQYMWMGTITGDVDYVFGDAAMVFDHTNFFTTWHGSSATGTETIEAQNKKYQTGSSNDYLSGYICNGCTLLSQSTGMTNLYYGRPYGPYSTWIMVNSFVDQVNPTGWIEFSGDDNLPTSTDAEYNSQPYTDPTPGIAPYPATLFGGTVTPTGGNTGTGVTGTRETESQDPGSLEAENTLKTQLTAAQAAQYAPITFLSASVPAQGYVSFTANWNPVTSLAAQLNAFAATGNVTVNSYGTSVTILGRPQTPGAGVMPTGTYEFLDGMTVLASGTLDASGEATFTTSTLATGTHNITMTYSGDANFTGGTSAVATITVPAAPLTPTTTALTVSTPSSTYGGSISGNVTVTQQTGSGTPTGSITFHSGATTVGSCMLSIGSCSYTLNGVPAGVGTITASYGGDTSFATSVSNTSTVNVARAILQVTANSYTIAAGTTLPAYAATITGFVNGDTQASATTGSPAITGSAANSNSLGEYPITITTGTLAASNYNFNFTNGYLRIVSSTQAVAVATGDTRTVTEPQFPLVCQVLNAAIPMVNNDIPTSVDATLTNPDGARIQAALNACSGTGQAVELSVDGSGNNAFLSGPLTMPSNVTLLVDPGVVLFFSRNAQDYDAVPGTHTCGTVNNDSATSSCDPLIAIPGSSTNVGIMGFGKLDGRGGDTLLNAIAPYQGMSWWGLSNAANGVGNQQNPRFIQIDTGASNITLYKITIRNSPLFHISTTGAASNFTAWDVKIVTPTTSRNTDGIDPGNATNFTITRSWISDGDDNVAVGASGSAPAMNISVTNNHFFAGHGQSIGSITEAGVNNILFDGNISAGNGFAAHGSAVSSTGTFSGGGNDGNSTGIRIKSDNGAGGLVTNVQYSNECLLDHATDIEFTPLYNTDTGTLTPNFKNILMQNVVFANDDSSTGTVQFTGAANNGIINPLMVTLDNATFPTALSASSFVTSGMEGTETNAQLTYGPGDVSSNFVSGWATFAGANGNTVTNNITATSLVAPTCSFTYLAPELTGPNGLPQTISFGQNATAVVILTPAVGGAAYPTGTVTLTDFSTGNSATVSLSGTGDTTDVPLSGLAVGTHTFTATYSGDSNYVVPTGASSYTSAGPYTVIVNPASLSSTTTVLSGVPSTISYGTAINAMATVTGSNPTGTVEFLVNGAVYATAAVNAGTASASISLPYSTTAYSIAVIYSGDNINAGSTSAAASTTVGAAMTTTSLSANTTSTPLGHPVLVTATVSSVVGAPTGSVTFSYTPAGSSTAVTLPSVSLVNGATTASIDLPAGSSSVAASYAGSGSFAPSTATAMTIVVNQPTIVPLPANPIALAYTISTIAGGGSATVPSSGNMNCAGATDKYGDGCQATAISLSSGDDLRGVITDPFGNVYFTDISSTLIRKIAPNGVISNFAGRVTGTACVPTATTGCTPTLVSLSKARGLGSDLAGNVYIADYSGDKVYKVLTSTGLMYLVAGTGTAGTIGDGGPATSAEVDAPRGAWGDTLGNVYIADTSANKIRVVDSAGNIHTFAGTGTAASSGDGGPATSAAMSNPQGVIVDPNLNVYIADSSGDKIRVVCVTCGTNSPLDTLLAKLGITSPVNGDIYTIAGGGSSSYSGPYPVLATGVSMSPQKLSFDLSGNLYISDGDGVIWFLDARSAQIRPIASNASTVCANATDSLGDGCPATQSKFGDGGNGIGVGTDALGNVYLTDTADLRIRKVSTNLVAASTAVGTTTTAPVEMHFIPGDTLATSSGIVTNTTEWSETAPMCTTNADATSDCLFTLSFTPAVPGERSSPLAVNSTLGNTDYASLTGLALGAGATLDPASQISFGANLTVAGLATDNAGNVYVSDSNSKQLLRFASSAVNQGSSAAGTTLTTLVAPGAVAIDPRGYVYVADTSAGTVTQISPNGAATVLPFTFTTPAGLAVDALNNLYVSDSSTKAVYQISLLTGAEQTLPLGTLVAPAGLSIDPNGNLLVADPGAPAIYRFNLQSNTRSAVSTSAIAPAAVVTDPAGNLLIADTAAILAVPASSNSAGFTVASLTPSALAIDPAGNLYTGSVGGVLKLERTQGYVQYATVTSGPQTVNMLEAGNQIYQSTAFTQSDATDYSLAPTATTDCTLSSTGAGALGVGGVCPLTATYSPTTYAITTDTVTFNGNLTNSAFPSPSTVNLVLTGPATGPTASITLGGFSPSSPLYGQPVTLSATVTGGALPPTGTVVFTVDSTTYNAPLVNGVATTTVSGLPAGQHNVSAGYTSSNGYASVSSSPTTLTIGQAIPSITWPTPGPITYGTALSAAQLDATASVNGSFSYTPASGAILNAGTQTLSVQFTPGNMVDYATVTKTALLTVNQAPSAVMLSANPNPAAQGKVDLLTATVTGAGHPGGNVIFQSGTSVLCTSALSASGAATCSFTPTVSGTLSISARYQGDTNHLASAATLPLSVYDTAIIEQFASTQLVYPGATNVTVCVAGNGPTPTGTVQIDDGSTVLTTLSLQGNGCAYWYISPGLKVGPHSITSVYSGNKNYAAGASAPALLTVSPIPVKMSVSCWNSSFPYGGNYQCTVNGSSNAGAVQGSITYSYDGGATVAVPLSNGNASLTITKPAVGNHTVAIGYAQQTNYAAASSQTEKFTVTAAPVIVALSPSTWYTTTGTPVTLQASVTSWSAGPPDDMGAVSFYDGSKLLAAVPVNSSGKASYTTSSLPQGNQTITATYTGGTNYASGSASVTISLVR
ncbi:MAG: pectinesterase family protein [Acidobacteriaceae bacterium]